MIQGRFNGPLVEGIREGQGALLWSNGDRYEGMFVNGLRRGHGIMREATGRYYEGSWAFSMRDGKGKEVFPNGDQYTGDFKRDKFHGEGVLETQGGKYTGAFANGYKDGKGAMHFKNGARYDGEWKENRFHGKGTYYWPEGGKTSHQKYEGEWMNGDRTGHGVTSYPTGERHDGMYFKNKKEGDGWWRSITGKVREGIWKDDVLVKFMGPEIFEAQMKAKKVCLIFVGVHHLSCISQLLITDQTHSHVVSVDGTSQQKPSRTIQQQCNRRRKTDR